ncbi:MAG: hypothetical protein V7720_11400 [Halioglobus sp.]
MKMLSIVYKNLVFFFSVLANFSCSGSIIRKFKKRYPHYAHSDADICIEGFPRSGNTFLVAALQHWNPGLKIDHHSHLASNIKVAVKNKIPAVVLVREPLEAVSSAMVWDGKLNASIGLYSYIHFYQSLSDCLPSVLLMEFSEFTQRPDIAVQKINQRFDLSLKYRRYDDLEREAIATYLAKHDSRSDRGLTSASLPNVEKEDLKIGCKEAINRSMLINKAECFFNALVSRRTILHSDALDGLESYGGDQS